MWSLGGSLNDVISGQCVWAVGVVAGWVIEWCDQWSVCVGNRCGQYVWAVGVVAGWVIE